jgi:hypothetical protein
MLSAELVAFLQEGLDLHIGARDEALQPEGARALAVAVDSDGRHLVVYAAERAAARLLPHLHANGQAAVSFGRPVDERACQVKGIVVDIRPARDDEHASVRAQWDGYMRQLERIGIPWQVAAGWTTWPAVAVRIKITAVFEQTPGPGAGTAIG